MILFLQIFISTNLPAHTDNPLRFKTRNKYAVLREKKGEKSTKRRNRNGHKHWLRQWEHSRAWRKQKSRTLKCWREEMKAWNPWRIGDIAPRVAQKGTSGSSDFLLRQQTGRVNEMKGNQEGGGLNLGKSEYWRPLNMENHQQPFVNKEERVKQTEYETQDTMARNKSGRVM